MAALAALLLAGCSGSGGEDEPVQVKVVYWDEPTFRQSFMPIVRAAYPHMTVEVVSWNDFRQSKQEEGMTDQLDIYKLLLEEERPDLLWLNEPLYAGLSRDARLVDLDPLIQRDGFDIDAFAPTVVQALRADGGLYGLTRSFGLTALFYNRDLIERAGAELPRNGMSWEETLLLAGQLGGEGPEGERTYGLYKPIFLHQMFQYLIVDIGRSGGLALRDGSGSWVLDSPSWRKAWEIVVRGIESEALYLPDPPIDYASADAIDRPYRMFREGRIAMVEANLSFLLQLQAEDPSLRWDFVTRPIDPARPSGAGVINGIFAISADAVQQEGAWQLLSLLHGESTMRQLPVGGELPSRPSLAEGLYGRDMSAFYEYGLGDRSAGTASLSGQQLAQLDRMANERLNRVLAGELDLESALAELQREAEAKL